MGSQRINRTYCSETFIQGPRNGDISLRKGKYCTQIQKRGMAMKNGMQGKGRGENILWNIL